MMMMWPKLSAIAQKDIFTTFQDRNAILIMFAMPLALSLIIALAFGTSGDVSIDAIPLAIVNQDQGALGQVVQDAFIPPDDATDTDERYRQIYDLTEGEIYTDPDQARDKVEDGDLAAVITIPPDFSQNALNGETVGVSVYYDSGRGVGSSVVSAILHAITSGVNTTLLAQRTGPDALAQIGAQVNADAAAVEQAQGEFFRRIGTQGSGPDNPVTLEQVDLQGETRSFDALQYFAPSMAILFMTFALATGATSILNEQRRWTLQRIITTPTPRWVFMGGKLGGIYITGVIQMILLIVSTSLIARLMGREASVWGTNYLGLALLVLIVVLAGTSLGLLIAALSETSAQASTYSTVALFLLGMLGGSFIPIEGLPDFLSWLPKITLNYWGIQGFFEMSYDEAAIGDIGTHLLVLVIMSMVFFAVSLWRFNRRLDV